LFDDAQDTYWDSALWNGLFKGVRSNSSFSMLRIVCFASHGSPYYQKSPGEATPEDVRPQATVGLFPSKYVNHSLLFTEEEFYGLMEQREALDIPVYGDAYQWPILDDDLKKYVFTCSNGHIGAIIGLLGLAKTARASG
jgi:hypothetical protein